MNTAQIVEGFNLLKIDVNSLPKYTGAEDFASRFVRCTVVEYIPISYSDSSLVPEDDQEEIVTTK